MKTPIFTGTCTALITPFRPSGSIDYDAFARQIDRQHRCRVRLRHHRGKLCADCTGAHPSCGHLRALCSRTV